MAPPKKEEQPKQDEVKFADSDCVMKITAPRFLNGEYVVASPEFPAIIKVRKGEKLDKAMFPADVELPRPKPFFNSKRSHPHVSEEPKKPAGVEVVSAEEIEDVRASDKKAF